MSLEGLTFRKRFIQGVHMYLWQDSHVARDSYKAFICIYGRIHMNGGIHIRSSHISMEVHM